MHNLEVNENGHIRGWIAGAACGTPGQVEIVTPGACIAIAATVPRPDVLLAGHTLYAGFDLTLSAGVRHPDLALRIGKRTYDITCPFRADAEVARIDAVTDTGMEGWIDHDTPLTALRFFDGETSVFADILRRDDIVHLKDAEPGARFGFSVATGRGPGPKVCVINGAHVHVFASAFQRAEVAA